MHILISQEEIHGRVSELAQQIQFDYQNKRITVIGVMTGSLIFVSDLIRQITLPLKLGLVEASSYRGTATSPGELVIRTGLLPDLRDQEVLLLDDILDSGHTLSQLKQHILGMHPASLRLAVLLRKKSRLQYAVEVDYCGFDIPDKFVVGYGLDFNDLYRNLPYIAELTPGNDEADLLTE